MDFKVTGTSVGITACQMDQNWRFEMRLWKHWRKPVTVVYISLENRNWQVQKRC
jgi:hypothetical protein